MNTPHRARRLAATVIWVTHPAAAPTATPAAERPPPRPVRKKQNNRAAVRPRRCPVTCSVAHPRHASDPRSRAVTQLDTQVRDNYTDLRSRYST
eukprot:5101752-Prymnesium_polylepis.1